MTNQKSFVNLIDYQHDISLDMVVLNINKVNQKASPQGLAFFCLLGFETDKKQFKS